MVAILSVLFFIQTGKDWGPMKKAEERAINTGQVLNEGAIPLISTDATDVPMIAGLKPAMSNMVLPLAILILMMPVSLFITGKGNLMEGSGSTAVFWSVLTSLVFTAALYIYRKVMNLNQYMFYFYKGVGGMTAVASILVFAFAIGNSISELGTGKFLASLVAGRVSGVAGPAIIFGLGGVMAFSTGTSWGTFAILMPIAIQMGVTMDANIYACIGAVVSGGVMGDHCSPISDTTILASMASASDHMDHVKTQTPYALASAGISLLMYIVIGFIT
jgi:Na+/H+ antiporter NhaC